MRGSAASDEVCTVGFSTAAAVCRVAPRGTGVGVRAGEKVCFRVNCVRVFLVPEVHDRLDIAVTTIVSIPLDARNITARVPTE